MQREIKAKCFPLKFRRYIILGGLGGTGDENGEGKLRWGEDEPNKQVQLATGCFRTFGHSFIQFSSAFTRFLLQQKHIQQRKESAINILEDPWPVCVTRSLLVDLGFDSRSGQKK